MALTRSEILLSRMTKNEMTAALARVLVLCEDWDGYTKGESPTTAAIRGAVRGD